MNTFRTSVAVSKSFFSITPRSNLCFLGSCFAEDMSSLLRAHAFEVMSNPSGMLYNPYSIGQAIDSAVKRRIYSEKDMYYWNGHYLSFDHATNFQATDIESLLHNINESGESFYRFIKKTDFLFLTFGTAWVYRHRETNAIVSNCHKIPASHFVRYRLTIDEIVQYITGAINVLRKINPEVVLVFTLSPVRHWKDGAHENQLSKAVLLLAVEELCRQIDRSCYFPAYEILLDDLRDYRFYKEDMLHPSKAAIQYIFEQFKECFFDPDTLSFYEKAKKIRDALNHKPLHPGSKDWQRFQKALQDEIDDFRKKYGKQCFRESK